MGAALGNRLEGVAILHCQMGGDDAGGHDRMLPILPRGIAGIAGWAAGGGGAAVPAL